jgi:hypothetical protein
MAQRGGGGYGGTLIWSLFLLVLALVAAIGLACYGCQISTIGRLVLTGCPDEGGARAGS